MKYITYLSVNNIKNYGAGNLATAIYPDTVAYNLTPAPA